MVGFANTGQPGGSAGGDLDGYYPSPVVIKLQGVSLSAVVPSTGQVLQYNGTEWVATTQAGDTYGTAGQFLVTNAAANASTWVSLSGDVVDSSSTPGALTVVSLSGSGGIVTATASNLNFSQTSHIKTTAGDLYLDATGIIRLGSSTTEVLIAPTNYTQLVSPQIFCDASNLNIRDQSSNSVVQFNNNGVGASNLTIGAGVTGFTIQQSSTSAATGASITIAPQASTATNGTPGGVTVNLAAPTGSGNHAGLTIVEASGIAASTGAIRLQNSNSTTNLPPLGSIVARNHGNTADINLLHLDSFDETVIGDGTNGAALILVQPAGGGIYFQVGGANDLVFTSSGAQFFSGSPSLGSGTGVLGIANASIIPTATVSTTGIILFSESGWFGINANGITFSSFITNPTITQDQIPGTGTTASTSLIIKAQPGQNVASGTNNNGGNLILAGGSAGTGGSGGTSGNVEINSGNTNLVTFSPGSGLTNITTSGLTVLSTTNGTFQLNCGGGAFQLTAGSSIVAYMSAGATDYITLGASPAGTGGLRLSNAMAIKARSTGSADLTLVTTDASNNIIFGDHTGNQVGTYVYGNTATALETASYGMTLLDSSGNLSLALNGLIFTSAIGAPQISQDTPTTDSATHAIEIIAQAALSTATTNVNGGSIILQSGAASTAAGTNGAPGNIFLNFTAPNGTGNHGQFILQDGGAYRLSTMYDGTHLLMSTPNGDPLIFQIGGTSVQWLSKSSNDFLALGPTASALNITASQLHYLALTSDVAPQALTIHAQDAWSPGGGTVTNNTGANLVLQPGSPTTTAGNNATGGSLIVSLAAPTGTGSEAFLQTTRGGSQMTAMGAYSSSYGGWWGSVGTPNTTNWAIISNGTTTQLNATSGLYLDINGSAIIALNTSAFEPYADLGIALGYNTNRFTAASVHTGISAGTATTSSTNPSNFTIAPEGPNAGASTKSTNTPGSLVVSLTAPGSNGNHPSFTVQENSVVHANFQFDGYSSIFQLQDSVYTPVNQAVTSIQTTDSSAHAAVTYPHGDNTLIDWVITAIGRNSSNNGDYYRADIVFSSQRYSAGAPSLNPNPPVSTNIRTSGGGSSYGGPSIITSGNSILIQVTGAASTTINWSITWQAQVRS